MIKISTVHNFKGMEAKTVFYIRNPGGGELGEEDDPKLIYTAINGSRENLVVFGSDNCSYS